MSRQVTMSLICHILTNLVFLQRKVKADKLAWRLELLSASACYSMLPRNEQSSSGQQKQIYDQICMTNRDINKRGIVLSMVYAPVHSEHQVKFFEVGKKDCMTVSL